MVLRNLVFLAFFVVVVAGSTLSKNNVDSLNLDEKNLLGLEEQSALYLFKLSLE